MGLLAVCQSRDYDLYLLHGDGTLRETRSNVGISEAYGLIEAAKRSGIAVVTLD